MQPRWQSFTEAVLMCWWASSCPSPCRSFCRGSGIEAEPCPEHCHHRRLRRLSMLRSYVLRRLFKTA